MASREKTLDQTKVKASLKGHENTYGFHFFPFVSCAAWLRETCAADLPDAARVGTQLRGMRGKEMCGFDGSSRKLQQHRLRLRMLFPIGPIHMRAEAVVYQWQIAHRLGSA